MAENTFVPSQDLSFVSMVIFFGLTRNQLALCKIFSSARTNVVSVHVISGLMRVDKDGWEGEGGRWLGES
jgi:hypothetical protein